MEQQTTIGTRLSHTFNAGWGCEVHTKGELEETLVQEKTNVQSYSILNIHLDMNGLLQGLDPSG